ncbi:MAG: DUF4251 domain-containing protein [Bacteroidales bacterium]|nr:DUF4251 domain-containing protein [Bacteroidales bacterium]MDT8432634.1 DUF4251 domain-containing protein [Bacteroidales bacterium]
MKNLAFAVTILMLGMGVHAQDTSSLSKREQRKLLKEEMQRQADQEAERYAKLVDHMVKSATFVLEADMLYDRYGNSNMVQYTINFISADSTRGVLQVGSNTYLGRNGVGGVTIDGSISSYEYSIKEKSDVYSVSYVLRSPVGSYDIHMTVQANGRADARVSGNLSGSSLRYSGRLVHPAESRVFKGSAL